MDRSNSSFQFIVVCTLWTEGGISYSIPFIPICVAVLVAR